MKLGRDYKVLPLEAFNKFLNERKPGEMVVYFMGCLMYDRQRNPEVNQLAKAVWKAMESGMVLLFQLRQANGETIYMARRCNSAPVKWTGCYDEPILKGGAHYFRPTPTKKIDIADIEVARKRLIDLNDGTDRLVQGDELRDRLALRSAQYSTGRAKI